MGFLSDGLRVLPDGRLVRNPENTLMLYTALGEKVDIIYETLSHDEGGFGGLTVDNDDHIYVSYWKSKSIRVYNLAEQKPIREIQCNEYQPQQIFAMNHSKKLVVKTDSKSVKIIDEFGEEEREVTKNAKGSPYPAICRDDSIIIAWIKYKELLVTIDKYTSDLQYVTKLVTDFKVQKPNRSWFYLQEFGSGELAFCTTDRLYIFY